MLTRIKTADFRLCYVQRKNFVNRCAESSMSASMERHYTPAVVIPTELNVARLGQLWAEAYSTDHWHHGEQQ